MAQYMFSAYGSETGPVMTEEEMQRSWQRILTLEEEMKSAGALVFSGRLLEPESSGESVKRRRQVPLAGPCRSGFCFRPESKSSLVER